METKKINLKASDVEFKDLIFLLKQYDWLIFDNLDAEPISKGFTEKFSSIYWYLQYHLLRDGDIEIDNDDLLILVNEKNVSYNWISLNSKDKRQKTKDKRLKIKLIDGTKWEIEYDVKLDIPSLLRSEGEYIK